MICSMTGFGEATFEEAGVVYQAEIRSVNNRYFKAAIRLPDEYAFLESDVERLLRERLTRGSITFRVFRRAIGPDAAQELNADALRSYVRQLRAVARDDPQLTIDLAALVALPGVCEANELDEEQRARAWELFARLVNAAVEALLRMRAGEGEALAADLRQHTEQVRTRLAAIRQRVPLVVTGYRDRLLARVQELIAQSNVKLAADDLLREVSIYAERSDISEELARLDAHLEQFHAALSSPEAAGRKLEFIAQEMLREGNTIAAKALDPQISREIIEVKAAIDRIKEQVLNVE